MCFHSVFSDFFANDHRIGHFKPNVCQFLSVIPFTVRFVVMSVLPVSLTSAEFLPFCFIPMGYIVVVNIPIGPLTIAVGLLVIGLVAVVGKVRVDRGGIAPNFFPGGGA